MINLYNIILKVKDLVVSFGQGLYSFVFEPVSNWANYLPDWLPGLVTSFLEEIFKALSLVFGDANLLIIAPALLIIFLIIKVIANFLGQ